MTNLTANQSEALRLLGAYTAGRYDFWQLAGDANSGRRQQIMTALEGKKMPKSKSGVTAMQAAFFAIAKPAGDYPRARGDAFEAWANEQRAARHAATLTANRDITL